LVYNSFGGDGGGIQCLLISPVSFRQIVFAKNLAQFTVLVTEILILWLGVCLIYNPPRLVFLALTFCWYLFATPVNFSIGNLLSLYSPKKIDYAVFGRQRASETTIFASLGVQLVIMGIGALTIFIGYRASNYWIGVLILAALAIPSITGYIVVLRRIDPIVMTRREVLATELCKAYLSAVGVDSLLTRASSRPPARQLLCGCRRTGFADCLATRILAARFY